MGAVCLVTALAVGDLAVTSAILQVLPLTLVLGAALFLGEKVGWRRWLSVAVGFAGVLLILRPGTAAFQPAMLWAVAGVAGLTLRDLATRHAFRRWRRINCRPRPMARDIPAGVVLGMLAGPAPVMPGPIEVVLLAGTVVFGVVGYATLVAASRLGEASVVAPFRYTRLAFALVVAAVIFGERPDAATLAGAALIALAGGYAMWREAGLRRRRPVDSLVRPGPG